MPNMIFISYNRKDEKWVDLFERALKMGVTRKLYRTFTDRQIVPGDWWDREIKAQIASATIALVLVTPELLESDYILKHELPEIVDRHSKNALKLQWVPIKKVEDYKLEDLQHIQAIWHKNRPLAEIEKPDDQRQAVEKICADLIKLLDVNTGEIGELESELKATLGTDVVLREQIALGDGSVIYRAEEDGEEIAVKVALPSMRRDWVGRDFVDRAKRLQHFDEPGFVGVRKPYSRGRINCVTMDYAGRSSLKNVIQESGTPGLEPLSVANVLAQVTDAANKLHLHQESADPNNEFPPLLVGPLRSSHVYRNPKNGKYKISPMQMSQATMQSGRARPMTVLQEDELTWLSPEQYAGERLQAATDQYYIGLLGLELLTGAPPVLVRSYADLDKKRTFFAAPMAAFEKHRKESPALFFVLARMLERRPEDRWPSMADAHKALKKIAEGSVPEEVRRKASKSYDELQDSPFYRNFYEELFRSAPDVQQFFRNINMDEQHRKLHTAVGKLLSFRPTDYPNPMSQHVESHERLGLQPKHFEGFRDAFLTALSSQKKADNYAMDAWRAIIDAGIAYMTTKRANGHQKVTQARAHSVNQERSTTLVRSGTYEFAP